MTPTPTTPTPMKRCRNTKDGDEEEALTPYEQSRRKRIKENKEKLQKLGLTNLSLKSSYSKPTPPLPPSKPSKSSISPPSRRSSRLKKNSKTRAKKKEKVVIVNKDVKKEETLMVKDDDSNLEIYTEEHDKLLGKCDRNWTLLVDGYAKDGRRISHPDRGKLCHQCGHTSVGFHTSCTKCELVQGQLCGDCLYTRYGENVLEANSNWDWICPVCRGICNCNNCREAKGWQPIGNMYGKVSSLGFKSIAHYLVQTRRG